MKRIFSILFALVLVVSFSLIVAAPVAADPATLHVDDDGVQWPGAYTTITTALAAASGGDIIVVHEGTYDETSRTQRGVYVGVTGVTLKGASGELRPVVIGGFYIDSSGAGATVEGFDVQQPWEAAIQVHGADGVTIRSNHVDGTGNLAGGLWPGISVLISNDVTVQANYIHDTTGTGIWLTCTNSLIRANRIENTPYTGILLAPHSGWVNSGNLIQANRVKSAGNRIGGADDGIRLGFGAHHNTVRNNLVTDAGRDGIRAVDTAHDNIIRNNVMQRSSTFDAHDTSTGGGTAGTANIWTRNNGTSESPVGLLD